MWTRSLCRDCNSMAGGRYDAAYAAFHVAVDAALSTVAAGFATHPNFMGIAASPSLVARSVLSGMFALSTQLRVVLPNAAHDLSHGEASIRWSEGHRLLLALNEDAETRAQGGMAWMRLVPPMVVRDPLAEIWFRPVARALAPVEPGPVEVGLSYFNLTGWVDVTDWINTVRPAPYVVGDALARAPRLASYLLPGDDPNLWSLMYHHDSSTMILGEDAWQAHATVAPGGSWADTSSMAGSHLSRTRSSSK